MELTIENLRTLSKNGQIFLTAHSQARLYERGILLKDIRQAIQMVVSLNTAQMITAALPALF